MQRFFEQIFTKIDEYIGLFYKCVWYYIIGDNPDAEIKAGNELNFKTIQILKKNVERGSNADFYIKTFKELNLILLQLKIQ